MDTEAGRVGRHARRRPVPAEVWDSSVVDGSEPAFVFEAEFVSFGPLSIDWEVAHLRGEGPG